MEREFGASGLRLPWLSLGLAALGRPAYLTLGHGDDVTDSSVDGMRCLTFEVLDLAYDSGLRHLDTAHSYGLAEVFLSEWLRTRHLSDLSVTSKWGYTYVGGWRTGDHPQEIKELSWDTYRRQMPRSLDLLGGNLVGYQIHSATVESGVLDNTEILDAMAALADRGLLIGISTSGPSQGDAVRQAVRLAENGDVPFSFVQSTWNLFEPSVEDALLDAAAEGFGIIIKEALANGRLVRGPFPEEVSRVAGKLGVGPDAVCIAAAASLPFRPVVLSGAVSTTQLRSNLRAAEVTLGPGDWAALRSLAQAPSRYWKDRAALPWT